MKEFLRKIKVLLRVMLGKDIFVRPDCACRTQTFGSDYGGWPVAVEGVRKDSIVYSFGIGDDISFDAALIERFGVTVHAFDPTPKSIAWLKGQNAPDAFILHEYGAADRDGTASFHPPENAAHISHTILDRPKTASGAIRVPVKRLSTIMRELGHDRIDILKMDIEGAEYGVLEDMEKTPIRPAQVLVEFHHRFPNVGLQKTRDAFDRLRRMGYCLFAVSSRNEEYSFAHRSTGLFHRTESK